VASRLARTPVEPTFETPTRWPSTNRPTDTRARPRDGDGEPVWGAPRIHGELHTLGINVSERTASRLLGQSISQFPPSYPNPVNRLNGRHGVVDDDGRRDVVS